MGHQSTHASSRFGHIWALGSNQYDDTVCAKIELRWYECAEAYGQYRSHKLCADLFDDMRECRSHEKEYYRLKAMEDERRRQYWAGERSKESRYAAAPHPDSFMYRANYKVQ